MISNKQRVVSLEWHLQHYLFQCSMLTFISILRKGCKGDYVGWSDFKSIFLFHTLSQLKNEILSFFLARHYLTW